MTKIFKAMPFGSARGERQNRVKSVECLDSAFLIDTEHCSIDRRLKIQANDVGRLLFKLRVIARHVPTHPMRLNTEMAPDATHARGFQDARLGLSCPRSALTTAITRIQSCQTLLLKALLPLPDIFVTAIQSLPNFPVRMTRC